MTKQNKEFLQLYNRKIENNRKIANALYCIERQRNKDNGYKYTNQVIQWNDKNQTIIY